MHTTCSGRQGSLKELRIHATRICSAYSSVQAPVLDRFGDMLRRDQAAALDGRGSPLKPHLQGFMAGFAKYRLSLPLKIYPKGYPMQPKTIGKRVRMHRMDMGLYQREVAESIGVSEARYTDGSGERSRTWCTSRRLSHLSGTCRSSARTISLGGGAISSWSTGCHTSAWVRRSPEMSVPTPA